MSHLPTCKASGITLSPEQRYTILAPTDAAFATRLRKSLGMQPSDLLAPANADRLHKVGLTCKLTDTIELKDSSSSRAIALAALCTSYRS